MSASQALTGVGKGCRKKKRKLGKRGEEKEGEDNV